MAAGDAAAEASSDGIEPPRSGEGRIRHTLSGWRALARIVYRDPEHLAERLTLYGAEHLGQPSLDWAHRVREARPEVARALIAEELRTPSAQVARIDGAITGTPFLIALVPGYLGYLWQEGRMVLRTAALYGRDPRELDTSAAVLALRGVHPTVDAAREALLEVRDRPLPEKPATRRPLRTWVHSIYVLLIFGGFLAAPSDAGDESGHPWLKAAFGFMVGAAIWVITWVFPLTFMIAMAWGCETHTRQLGQRALIFYGGEAETAQAAIAAAKGRQDRGHGQAREPARGAARPVCRRSDRLRGLRQPRPPEHRHQLARRDRRTRRALPRRGHDRHRKPALTTYRQLTDPAQGEPQTL